MQRDGLTGAVRAAPGDTLRRCHAAALAGAQPGPAVAAALASTFAHTADAPRGGVHVLALGKAAHAMASAAAEFLTGRGLQIAGGLVVAHHAAGAPHPALTVAIGDHPVPGPRSAAAAEALGRAAASVAPDTLALVLLSGGTSSLIGASIAPAVLAPAAIGECSRVLLASGAPIDLVNAVRKRVSRWGAGRLAQTLAPARVLCLAVSDVPGDDPAVIGSGPCAPDAWTADRLRATLGARALWDALPMAVRRALREPALETPKPGDPVFDGVALQVICRNGDARRTAAAAAREAGYAVVDHPEWLEGEASACGERIAALLLAATPGEAHVWGGEPTVTLGTDADARGGRMQELALAAARMLDAAGERGRRVRLLAAGTDGRDGPTDAAGAIIDAASWARMRAAGRDPGADLARHRSHDALAAADALLPARPTGTNVADIVIGLAVR